MRHPFKSLPVLGAIILASFATTVQGHAILLSAAPGSDEIVDGDKVKVNLRFNSRIDIKRSRLVLVLPSGVEQTLETTQPFADTVTSRPLDLAPGPYVIRWQVLAEDGHITRGELAFSTR